MGREQPDFAFVMREFAPGRKRLGIDSAELWYTIYGNRPQMPTIGNVSNRERLQAILQSEAGKNLRGGVL